MEENTPYGLWAQIAEEVFDDIDRVLVRMNNHSMRKYYGNNLLRYEKRRQITEKDLKFILSEVTDVHNF